MAEVKQAPLRLFVTSPLEEQKRVKNRTIKGVGLLARNAQTLDQGVKILRGLIPSLTANSIPIFLSIMLRVKDEVSEDNSKVRAVREVVKMLGECVSLQPDLSRPYGIKIIQYIISKVISPSGSIEKMHIQCASSLTAVASSISPGPVLSGLFQLYNTKRRIGPPFLHLQNGVSLALRSLFESIDVQNYLLHKKESLEKVIVKLLGLLACSGMEFVAAPILQVWCVLLRHIDGIASFVDKHAPQLISSTIQALSSGSDEKGSGTVWNSTLQWKNRAEAATLLSTICSTLSVSICKPYGNEVVHYLEEVRHDRIKAVRDEVACAIVAWREISKEKKPARKGNASMDFSSFAYDESMKGDKKMKKNSSPFREFMKQNRKKVSTSPAAPVVLVPRSKNTSISATPILLHDNGLHDDGMSSIDFAPSSVPSPSPFSFLDHIDDGSEKKEESRTPTNIPSGSNNNLQSPLPFSPIPSAVLPTYNSPSFSNSPYSSFPYSRSPMATPLPCKPFSSIQHLAPTPIQHLAPTPIHYTSSDKEFNILAPAITPQPPQPPQATDNVFEDIYTMNETIKDLCSQQISLVDSVTPESSPQMGKGNSPCCGHESKMKELLSIIKEQQEQIQVLKEKVERLTWASASTEEEGEGEGKR